MTAAFSRQELHARIDAMPDASVRSVAAFIHYLDDEYWRPVIEPASPEESAIIDAAAKEYERDPSSFTSWSDIRGT